MAQKQGKKLRRSPKHKNMYAAQFERTRRNKINRLRKRVTFDKTASDSIKRLMMQIGPGRSSSSFMNSSLGPSDKGKVKNKGEPLPTESS